MNKHRIIAIANQREKEIDLWRIVKKLFVQKATYRNLENIENLDFKLERNFGRKGEISKTILKGFRDGKLQITARIMQELIKKLNNSHYRHAETNYDQLVRKENRQSALKKIYS